VHISSWREPGIVYCDFSRFASRLRKFEKRGVHFDPDFRLKARSKPYINAEFFLDYIRTVFLSNLNELRALEEFADEDAVLLMDTCPGHVTDETVGFLQDDRVRVITWASHTTQIFQPVDISLFGVLKRRGQYK
jgi:hypothetical protein